MPPSGHSPSATDRGRAAGGRRRAISWVGAGAALAAALLCAPFVLGFYSLRILSSIYMYATLATAINIIAGYAGYAAFGNVVFFGLGAYTTAILMVSLKLPFGVALCAGAAAATGFALVLGPPLLRLKGHYFAIATLGLNEATRALFENWGDTAGGGKGLSLPLRPGDVTANARFFYFLLFGLMALSTLLAYALSRSRFGYACRAIRLDEEAAASSGINTAYYKTIAWAVSAGLTGAVGCIYAYWFSYIDPSSVFDMDISVKSFVIFLLGGPATVLGPVLAAFGFELISTLVWSHLLNFHLGVFGALIVMTVILMPRGLVPFLDRWWGRAAARRTRAVPTSPAV
jgi:branched-chain amino acid transport system permease protein